MRRALPALLLLCCAAPPRETEAIRSATGVDAGRGARPAGRTPTSELWLDVFPAYPGARLLCSQSVSGVPLHIVWSAYATTDPPERVRAFYEEGTAARMIDRSNGFRLVGPDRRIASVHARGESYPQCEVPLGAGDQTVFIVSRAVQ